MKRHVLRIPNNVWPGVLLFMLTLLPCLAQGQTVTLRGSWRPVHAGDTPAQVLNESRKGRLATFDPSRLHRFNGELGAWVVLRPVTPLTTQDRMLSVRSPSRDRVTLYAHGRPLQTTAIDDFRAPTHGLGRLSFRLPTDVPDAAPLLLKFERGRHLAMPVSFRLQSGESYRHQEAVWLSMVSACFGVMLAMALMALCFALILRDLTFIWYAGYIISYVVLQGMQTGYLFHPLGLSSLASSNLSIGSLVIAMSVGFAILFMLRFCDFRRYAVYWRKPLLGLAFATSVIVAGRNSNMETLRELSEQALNPLLIVTSLAILAAALTAALRGSGMAWFFLAGWTPLLGLTALSSAQTVGALPGIDWLNDVLIVAGALESIVLSIGLAYRQLGIRRERDSARTLADTDALTGLLNRRAWSDAAMARMMNDPTHSQVLFFMDLDHFKELNDRHGHVAGDNALMSLAQVLRNELRPVDLVGRYGGEEFVAMIGHIGIEEATQVAARLCRRIDALSISLDDKGTPLTISIGIAGQRSGDSLTSLLMRADTAMYQAKAGGRNQVKREPPAHIPPRLRMVSNSGGTRG